MHDPRHASSAQGRHNAYLMKVKKNGSNPQHPADDPLWDSAFAKYWLNPRPERFDVKKRKASSRDSARRYYKKRKVIQETQADEKKSLYIERKIVPDEYKKILLETRDGNLSWS